MTPSTDSAGIAPAGHQRTITVDQAIGSHELCPALISAGLPAHVGHLEFADFAFDGNGPGGTVSVGIERKRVSDLLSSLHTGRLAGHQLPGLIRAYDYVWLFVEGQMRPGLHNILEYYDEPSRRWYTAMTGQRRQMTYPDIFSYLTSIETCTKVKVRCTDSASDTVAQIGGIYRWFGKEWEAHKSFVGFHHKPPSHVALEKPSFMRRVVKELDGIGWDKSYAVERAFGDVMTMAIADAREWMQIDGIGKKLAQSAVDQIRGVRP